MKPYNEGGKIALVDSIFIRYSMDILLIFNKVTKFFIFVTYLLPVTQNKGVTCCKYVSYALCLLPVGESRA